VHAVRVANAAIRILGDAAGVLDVGMITSTSA
jgi:hypothetical protein